MCWGDGVRLRKEAGQVTVQLIGTGSVYYVTFIRAITTHLPSTLLLTHSILISSLQQGGIRVVSILQRRKLRGSVISRKWRGGDSHVCILGICVRLRLDEEKWLSGFQKRRHAGSPGPSFSIRGN